jgi:hypothetical protein
MSHKANKISWSAKASPGFPTPRTSEELIWDPCQLLSAENNYQFQDRAMDVLQLSDDPFLQGSHC